MSIDSPLKYEDFIDGIMFINLTERTDRLKIILDECNKVGIPKNMIHRIDAVLDKTCGHLGCTKSHIKAIEYAKEMKWKRFLILEDDFQFKLSKDKILDILSEFFKKYNNKWDIFMFTTYWNQKIDTDIDYIKRIKYGTTTAGYLVNFNYTDTLLNNFLIGMRKLEEEVEQFKITNPNEKKFTTNYALDQFWFALQSKDNFYISDPTFGSQSSIWSSIMSK